MSPTCQASLAERLAVAEYLNRFGRPSRALENELLRRAGQMAPADRMLLARLAAREGNRPRPAASWSHSGP